MVEMKVEGNREYKIIDVDFTSVLMEWLPKLNEKERARANEMILAGEWERIFNRAREGNEMQWALKHGKDTGKTY